MQHSKFILITGMFIFLPLFTGCSRNNPDNAASPGQVSQRIQAIQQDPHLPAEQKQKMIASLQSKGQ